MRETILTRICSNFYNNKKVIKMRLRRRRIEMIILIKCLLNFLCVCVCWGQDPNMRGHYTATRDRSWCIYRQKHKYSDKSNNARGKFSRIKASLCRINMEVTTFPFEIISLTPFSHSTLKLRKNAKREREVYELVSSCSICQLAHFAAVFLLILWSISLTLMQYFSQD